MIEITQETKDFMMDELHKIHTEAFNKGGIAALETIKKYLVLFPNASVEDVIQTCNLYIGEINKL